ncbi:urea transporter [Vibrio makurazakiensis]|uniref:urea transporter n=1 Tax=Vibrio makurazakiensis TaxID=2910250 RepID=UPI003D0FFE9B
MALKKEFSSWGGLLNGIGQVYFTPSIFASFLVLCAIAAESPSLATLTLFGAAISYGFAVYSNKLSADINDGLYSLNGALIGLFIGNFYVVTLSSWFIVAIGALLTVPVAKVVFRFKTYRGYTCAFICIAWLLHGSLSIIPQLELTTSNLAHSSETHYLVHLPQALLPILNGISQVAFMNNAFAGLLILLAILVNNIKHGLWVVLAVSVATGISSLVGASPTLINQGLYGYNATLTALALLLYSGIAWPFILIGVVLSCFVTLGFHWFGLLPLTAPFILSTWAIVYLSKLLGKYCSINVQGSESK